MSLLLCALAVGLGAHSYRVGRLVQWHCAWLETPLRVVERRHNLGVSWGTFAYSITTHTIDHTDPLIASDSLEARRGAMAQGLHFDVFIPRPIALNKYRVVDLKVLRYIAQDPATAVSERAVLVPFWVVAPLLAVLPAWWFVRYRRRAVRRRRLSAGQCLRCGYDLRAQLPGDRCPECGAPVVADAAES